MHYWFSDIVDRLGVPIDRVKRAAGLPSLDAIFILLSLSLGANESSGAEFRGAELLLLLYLGAMIRLLGLILGI